MGRTARTRHCRPPDHKPDESVDKKSLAGATVQIVVETDCGLTWHRRAAGKNEVLLQFGKNPSGYSSRVEPQDAEETALRPGWVYIRDATGTELTEGGRSERQKIFPEQREAHPRCARPWSAQGFPEPRACRLPRSRRSQENCLSRHASLGSAEVTPPSGILHPVLRRFQAIRRSIRTAEEAKMARRCSRHSCVGWRPRVGVGPPRNRKRHGLDGP